MQIEQRSSGRKRSRQKGDYLSLQRALLGGPGGAAARWEAKRFLVLMRKIKKKPPKHTRSTTGAGGRRPPRGAAGRRSVRRVLLTLSPHSQCLFVCLTSLRCSSGLMESSSSSSSSWCSWCVGAYSPSALCLPCRSCPSLLLLGHGESSSVASSFCSPPSDTGDTAGEAPASSEPEQSPGFPVGGFSPASV